MARARTQMGSLWLSGEGDKAKWSCRFWVRIRRKDGSEVSKRINTIIGPVSGMTRDQAQTSLFNRIKEEQQKHDRLYLVASAVTGDPLGLEWRAKGAFGELSAAVDLMRRGFEVFRNLNPQGECDLLAMIRRVIYRVEVKFVASRKADTDRFFLGAGCFDLLAVVSGDGSIQYFDSAAKTFDFNCPVMGSGNSQEEERRG